jgi:tetratricopeptide (TPR) repeat protein
LQLGQASGQPDASIFFVAQHFQIRLEQGRLGEMDASIAEIVARQPGVAAFACLLAVTYTELGRNDEARALFERYAACAFQNIPRNVARLRSLTCMATVAAHLGDLVGAAVLYRLLAPYAEHVDEVAGLGAATVGHYLGILATTLGRFDEAENHFSTASASHARLGAPTWLARTRLEWSRMLLGRRGAGDTERARELLGQALTTARELGLANLERRTVALLGSDCHI